MSRVNVGIPPKELSNQHLLAEHREIKRLPNHLKKYGLSCIKQAPNKFTLGTGHVLFLLKFGAYTYYRYLSIHEECKRRRFNVTDYSNAWKIYSIYTKLWEHWEPSKKDIAVIKKRICERSNCKTWKQYKNKIK